jgi:hypothetical protein
MVRFVIKRRKAMAMWIQKARKRMEKKGTVGKFGKATSKKIKAGLKAGGEKAKEAGFAKAMKKIALRRKRRGGHGSRSKSR